MAKRDYYSVLGVQRNATEKDIKQAYRRLARQYHPDVNPGDADAEQKFKEISEAYSVLSHTENRQKYDRFGHQVFSNGFDPSAAGGFGTGDAKTFRDFFTGRAPFTEGVGGLFDELFGAGRQRTERSTTPGRDVEQQVEISFDEAMRGTTVQIQPPSQQGRVERLQVKIPPGVGTGSKIRLAGKGAAGKAGGKTGDLYIIMQVRPHAYFERQGSDILTEVPVTLSEALLGARIEVPTIDGPATMTLPAGTQNGQRFRLRGKGAPHMQGRGRGDQYVTVRVVLPDKLDARSQELLEEFMARNPVQPRAHMPW